MHGLMPIPFPTKPPPFLHTWWVTDQLLAGPYPGDVDERTAESNLKSIVDGGVSVFVNLQEYTETGMGYKPFPDYRPIVRRLSEDSGSEPVFHRFPIKDMGVTNSGVYREALDRIDQANAAGRGVYVHCWGGHGRTGTIIGCWMVRHSLTPDQALVRMSELRKHDDYQSYMDAPQTRGQVK